MKALLKQIKPEFILESLGVCLVTYGIAQFSAPLAFIALGIFLVWLVESTN